MFMRKFNIIDYYMFTNYRMLNIASVKALHESPVCRKKNNVLSWTAEEIKPWFRDDANASINFYTGHVISVSEI